MKVKQSASDSNLSTPAKAKYRITNWPEYDRALVKRGDITVWFDEEFIRCHWRPDGVVHR